MFKSHIKIAWRNLIRDRQFSILNLAGLSASMACVLLIYFWIGDERNVDKFNNNDSRLFQVIRNVPFPDGIQTQEATPGLLAKSLKEDMPEVEEAISVNPMRAGSKGIISFGNHQIKASELYVSAGFFNVFTIPLLQGDKQQALASKNAVVLSEELAIKIFNTTDNIIGRVINWGRGKNSDPYIVSGVCKQTPSQSTLQFDILFSYEMLFEKNKQNYSSWGNNNPFTYVVLKKGIDPEQFNKKIRDYSKSKYLSLYGNDNQVSYTGSLFTRRFSDKYLYGRYENGVVAGGRIEYVRLFTLIAIFILVIACINFTNLSTARASRRLKEVGIKKVSGANRKELIVQFLGESVIITLVAMIFSVILVLLFLPAFNHLTNKELVIKPTLSFLLQLFAITAITGILAGTYPAFYLSGFKPVAVLKGKLRASMGELWIRKGLVVMQFALSTIFIIAVLLVYQQMKYVQAKNLGYNKENIISFKREGQLINNLAAFLTEVKKTPGVLNAASFGHTVTGDYSRTENVKWPGQQPGQQIEFANLRVGWDLMELLQLKMKEGRQFSSNYGTDSAGVIFNEIAIATMGLKNPVGQSVVLWGKETKIIGVVKNFHFEALTENIKPCFLYWTPGERNILVKIRSGQDQATIAALGKLYKTFTNGLEFEYTFLEEDYQHMYVSHQLAGLLLRYFAGLAIAISCLGLLGLAMFTTVKRQKEIGIRKVLGATATRIALMLSGDYLKLVIVAVIIATPLSWWILNKWLQEFAFRVTLGPGIFIIAALAVVGITLLTITSQAIKAAITNPARSLKSE